MPTFCLEGFSQSTSRRYLAKPKTSVSRASLPLALFLGKVAHWLLNVALDVEASKAGFEQLAAEIKSQVSEDMSLEEIAWAAIKVANETMSRPIRALTEARGYAAQKHILAAFGGAAGQHACSLAKTLGIKTVLVHRFSSILSAYGMSLSDR